MKRIPLTFLLVGLLCCMTACFQGDNARNEDDANDAAGTGDADLARRVSGTWLLSTDYNYDLRCNYLPVEYVQSLFKLGEDVKLEKYDLTNGCEVRWDGQKVGLYFEEGSPYESTFKSEYAFDRLYQPGQVAILDSISERTGVKQGSYHGPKPEGTAAERPAEGSSPAGGIDPSAKNDSTNQPTPGKTDAAARLVAPAQNTATGIAINGVGDKAIWEPAKRTLHVLHLNHILSVTAPMTGSEKTAREGAMAMANTVIGRLFNEEA